jgi:hypothetical protein
MTYDYETARIYCRKLEMKFMEEWVPAIDKTFTSMGLTQSQVDALMWEYCWRTKHLFTPTNYSYWSRIKIALYFLFSFSK